jgi:hypothetical protein
MKPMIPASREPVKEAPKAIRFEERYSIDM